MVRARRSGWTAALAIVAALVFVAPATALPPDFQSSRFATVSGYPTSLAFLPDGRGLVTTLGGKVHVVGANGTFNATPALSLAVCTFSEQGLQGIAISPTFATDGYVYLYYTRKRAAACDAKAADGYPVNRLSRFTMNGSTGVIDPATERVLLDGIPARFGNHNGGAVHFGADGNLFVSVGDGGCHYTSGSCGLANNVAQELNSMQGKLLRITADGGVPGANPYVGTGSTRCALTGFAAAGTKCQEIYASGLRNPFRMGFDVSGTPGRFFINDVGGNVWDEIDVGQKGANYGWPQREGRCVAGSATNCPPPPAGVTDPIHAYNHDTGCKSITGGAFVPSGAWPSSYTGAYLYGDYVCNKLFLKASPAESGAVSEFATDVYNTTDMTFGPGANGGRDLYVLVPTVPEIRRIAYVGAGNRAPVAAASASPRSGLPPLTVAFNGAASKDADGDALTYAWSFGDGGSATGSAPSHVYNAAGRYTARLTVTDPSGASDATTVVIEVGHRPAPVIDAPAAGARFTVGGSYTLTGHASDTEDGALPASSLTWEVWLRHGDHLHPYVQPVAGNNVPFKGPAPENLAAAENSNLEIRLTAVDSDGLTAQVTRVFDPARVALTFQTSPAGLELRVSDRRVTGPTTVTSWQGHTLAVDAPPQADGERLHLWTSWSDGGGRGHSVVTPSAPATYTATFRAAPGDDLPDFDGDGYGDAAAGAPDEDDGAIANAGVVGVLRGSATGLRTSGGQELNQSALAGYTESGDRLGASSAAGDFNGDGRTDLAAGAPDENVGDYTDAGFVNIGYGAPGGLTSSGAQQLGQTTVAGYLEVFDRFGAALAAGDFDGDGYDDLAIGTPGEDDGTSADAGYVNVIYGSPSGLNGARVRQLAQGSAAGATEAGDEFGTALAAGDFDGDGLDDLAVGAPGEDVGAHNDAGAVNVLRGAPTGLGNGGAQQVLQSGAGGVPEAGDRFGTALATGSFDGNLRADLAIGVPDEDDGGNVDAGFVNVVYGTTGGLGSAGAQQLTQAWGAGAGEAGDRFGAALAGGDVDADGDTDLVAGAPGEDNVANDAGVVNVVLGGTGALLSTGGRQLLQSAVGGQPEADDHFGAAVATVDLDDDAYADLLLGAPDEDDGALTDAGVVHVAYGSPGGVSSRAQTRSQSPFGGAAETGDRFAAALP